MNVLIISFTFLFLLLPILAGKQIGQEGFKNSCMNPNTKVVFIPIILAFFLATGIVESEELEHLNLLVLPSIISFIFSIFFFKSKSRG